MAVKYGFSIEPETLDAIRTRAPRIIEMAAERVTYELSVIFCREHVRRRDRPLRRTRLAEPLGLHLRDVHVDDVLAGGFLRAAHRRPAEVRRALALERRSARDVITLRHLIEQHDRIALYDAGDDLAPPVPPVLRALGRDDTLDLPDFSTRPLLTGDEIARITGIAPGQELGASSARCSKRRFAAKCRRGRGSFQSERTFQSTATRRRRGRRRLRETPAFPPCIAV